MSVWTLSIIGVIGLVILTFVLTGPGIWSENWGWKLMNSEWSWKALKEALRRKPKDGGPPQPPAR